VGAKRFVIRRFWRLYPPFWTVLAWACIAKFSGLWDKHFLWGLTMLPSAVGVDNALGHFWTLEIELLFYLLLLTVFLVFGRLSFLRVLLIYLVVLGVSWIWPVLPMARVFWTRLPLFFSIMLWGACCRGIMHFDFSQWRRRRLSEHLIRAILIGGVTGLLAMKPLINVYFGLRDGDAEQVNQFLTVVLSVFTFLFWVILRPVQIQWLAKIGRGTYSVYLWHMVPIHAVVLGIQGGGLKGLGGWPLAVYVMVFLPVCFALGAAAYRWIEQPSDRIGKRLAG